MNRSSLALAFGVTALFGGTASAGPVGLIDDFGDTSLSEYTFTKVLDQGAGTTNISFSSPSGALGGASTGTTGAEQVLFFRNDGFSLSVGEELQIDGPVTGSGNDLGIVVGATPTAGVRQDFLFVSYRSPTQINARGFNGTTELAQAQAFGVTTTGLFIARTTTDTYEVGYYNGAIRTILSTRTGMNAAVGNNVGFYADLRADGAGFSGLDNLRIALIPEPASMALLGLGGLLVGGRRRVS